MSKKIKNTHDFNQTNDFIRESGFDYSPQFDLLTNQDKNDTYKLLVKNLLSKNKIEIYKIEKNVLHGNYKSIHFIIFCLYRQPCDSVGSYYLGELEKKLELESNDTIGLLVSNSFYSDDVIQRALNNNRTIICHENDIVESIKSLDAYNKSEVKDTLKNLNEMTKYQEQLTKLLKKKYEKYEHEMETDD